MATEVILNNTASFRDALLYRAQQGDKHAQDGLYTNLTPLIESMAKARCWALGLDWSYVEDIVQTTFLYILEPDRARYNPRRGNASRYLTGLVWNAAKGQLPPHWLRSVEESDLVALTDVRLADETQYSADDNNPASVYEAQDYSAKTAHRVAEVLARREPQDVDVVYMRAVEERPFAEIARLTDMSRFKAYRRYVVAIAGLQRGLQAFV